MFPRIPQMRFRFPRFVLRICFEGVDDNITTNLTSLETLVGIGDSGLNRKAHSLFYSWACV
jgi:hypothetical protein